MITSEMYLDGTTMGKISVCCEPGLNHLGQERVKIVSEKSHYVRCIRSKGCTRNLNRTMRGLHRKTDVMPDGRSHVLDTGQNVYLELLKKHVSAPGDWAPYQHFRLHQTVLVVAVSYVKDSNQKIVSDILRDYFCQNSCQMQCSG